MEPDAKAIAVFTGKSIDRILEEGGSSSWVLNRANAMQCRYLVCCRSGIHWVEGPEPQGSAFLVGVIEDVVPSLDPDSHDRCLIKISKYAAVAIPDVWQGWRNPVRYTTLSELGIDIAKLEFKSVPENTKGKGRGTQEKHVTPDEPSALTIAQAKRGLAKTFNVSENSIEIMIRG